MYGLLPVDVDGDEPGYRHRDLLMLLGQGYRSVYHPANGARHGGGTLRSAAKSARSSSQEMATPQTSPQKAAPIFTNGMSATVTRKAMRAPSEKRSLKAVMKAACRIRSMARPATAITSDFGATSINLVKVGASMPNKMDRTPTKIADVYCRLRSPLAATMALEGPVRHVLIPPTSAVIAEPMPHAIVLALIGGS